MTEEKLNELKTQMNNIIHYFMLMERLPGGHHDVVSIKKQLREELRTIHNDLPNIIDIINSITVDNPIKEEKEDGKTNE